MGFVQQKIIVTAIEIGSETTALWVSLLLSKLQCLCPN